MRPRTSRVSASARPPWGTGRPDASSESGNDAVAERTVGSAERFRLTAERNGWRRAGRLTAHQGRLVNRWAVVRPLSVSPAAMCRASLQMASHGLGR